MTWTWAICKFATTTSLGTISANPIGWVVGGSASQAVMSYSELALDSSDSDFSRKVYALMAVQWVSEYRYDLIFGAAGKGASFAFGKTLSSSSKFGKEAAREIAKNNGKFTPVARDLILKGKGRKFLEKVCVGQSWVAARETVFSTLDLLKEQIRGDGENWVLETNRFLDSLDAIISWTAQIKGSEDQHGIDKDGFHKQLLDTSRENVSTYIRKWRDYDQRCIINERINKLLKTCKQIRET